MYTWSSLSFQDSTSPSMEMIIFFHDTSMLYSTVIMAGVMYVLYEIIKNNLSNRYMLQGHHLEIVWTLTPIMILTLMAMPSLSILYLMEDELMPCMTLKTTGHQWYWEYEYPEFEEMKFSSFMVQDLNPQSFRLLDVTNRTVLPMNVPMRIIVSSEDVIHSWTIPSIGIKMDATPGRINQMSTIMKRPGSFYGQCSEICGLNHSFMPINVEVTSPYLFTKWVYSNLQELY